MISLGLDVSATSTGIVALRPSRHDLAPPVVLHESAFKPKTTGLLRCSDVADAVLKVLVEHRPSRIVIEGYALGRFSGSSIQVVSVGTIVRYFVRQSGHAYLEPSPSELKEFVTGKGNARKEHMMMEVLSKWGHKSRNNDTADAYGLACMGLAWSGKLAMTAQMKKIVGKLKLNQ